MKTLYLVSERTYEYDDEVYRPSRTDNNSVNPLTLFSSKEKAEQKVFELTRDFLQSTNIGEFGYDVDDVFDERKLQTLVDKHYFNVYSKDREERKEAPYVHDMDLYQVGDLVADIIALEEFSDVDQELLEASVKIKFFKVVEVELEY